MKILTAWLRTYLPTLPVSDPQLAEDLTLRGIAVEGVHSLGEGNGHLFEMDITTNRVDAMNHFGIAREAAAIYNLDLAPLSANLAAARPVAQSFPIRIDPAAEPFCGRFTAQVLRDVTIQPSSGQIKTFFNLLEQKPISNAVDASNFTLLGMGHPTHAFDLDRIEGGIVVRLARRGETLKLLDGTTRALEPDDLVIADEAKALSLAGVMGGWESMITAATRNILVEAAWFDPAAIRRSSRRHLLHTDASHRFERGADFNAAPLANALVSRLILADGGHPEGGLIDLVVPTAQARTAGRPSISLSVVEVQRHLGATIEDNAAGESALSAPLIRQYLGALGCTLSPFHADPDAGAQQFTIQLPSWRLDLEREIDLIEEVARVFGYNRFANTLPAPLPVLSHGVAPAERAVRARLLALGFSETISSTFASAAEAALFSPETDLRVPEPEVAEEASSDATLRFVRLENPLSEEASLLRASLVPGMLGMLAHNLHRDVRDARLFEAGGIFTGVAGDREGTIAEVFETPSLALGLTAAAAAATALVSAAEAPIFELKGVIESLVSLFALPGGEESLSFTTAGVPAWLEPGRSGVALLHRQPVAFFGELAASEAARRKLRQPVYLAALHLDELLALPLRRHTAHELSRFQAVERDFSFFFPDTTSWQMVRATITALALADLQAVAPLEIFRDPKGKAVPAGQHSLLLRTVFQSANRTLTEADIAEATARITEALTTLGGRQRA